MASIHPKQKPQPKPVATKPAPKAKVAKAAKVAPVKATADFKHLIQLGSTALTPAGRTKLAALYDALRKAESGKGYDQACALGRATGLTWQDWGNLVPVKVTSTEVNAGEQAMRDLELAACPEFCTEIRVEHSRLLQLAANASTEEIAKQARANAPLVPVRDAGKATSATEELTKLGNEYPQFLAAIDDPTKLAKLGLEQGRLNKGGNRLRSRLFMGLLSEIIEQVVPKAKHTQLGTLYQSLADKAKGVQKQYVAKHGAVSADLLRDEIIDHLNQKVIDTIDKADEADKAYEAKPLEELAKAKANEDARGIFARLAKLYHAEQLNWLQYTTACGQLQEAGFVQEDAAKATKRDGDTSKAYSKRSPKPVAAPKADGTDDVPEIEVYSQARVETGEIGDAA